jgi:hypothetical protein
MLWRVSQEDKMKGDCADSSLLVPLLLYVTLLHLHEWWKMTVRGSTVYLQKANVQILIPRTSDVTLFGNRFVPDVTIKTRSSGA